MIEFVSHKMRCHSIKLKDHAASSNQNDTHNDSPSRGTSEVQTFQESATAHAQHNPCPQSQSLINPVPR